MAGYLHIFRFEFQPCNGKRWNNVGDENFVVQGGVKRKTFKSGNNDVEEVWKSDSGS